jgi:hypothetical protein
MDCKYNLVQVADCSLRSNRTASGSSSIACAHPSRTVCSREERHVDISKDPLYSDLNECLQSFSNILYSAGKHAVVPEDAGAAELDIDETRKYVNDKCMNQKLL